MREDIEIQQNARIADIRNSYKNLERILFIGFANTSFDIPLNLCLSLFPMTREA